MPSQRCHSLRSPFPEYSDVLVLEVSLAAALVVLRLGHFRRASMVYLAGVWIWATLIFIFFGGVHSTGMVLYVSLPVSAAWLLGYRAALWTAGGCLLSALVFAVLETMAGSLRQCWEPHWANGPCSYKPP